MSDDEEGSLSFYLKNKEKNEGDENLTEIEKDKKEEEEIFNRYEKIGNLTDIKSIKESDLSKNYDEETRQRWEYDCIKFIKRCLKRNSYFEKVGSSKYY